jgi:hypothetical protein
MEPALSLEKRLDARFKRELKKHDGLAAQRILRRTDMFRAAMITSAPFAIRSYSDFE